MEPDLRFDSRSRTSRMLSVCVAIIVVTLGAVPAILVGLAIGTLRNLRSAVDAAIALIWYPIEMIRVNWKD